MGQKVNPVSFRLQLKKDWQSRWITKKGYRDNLIADLKLRQKALDKLSRNAGVSRIDIERTQNSINITIHTARPGVIIGRGGAGIEDLKRTLEKQTKQPVKISIMEIRKPELDAKLLADSVATQLEKRVGYRRAMKMAVESAVRAGALGVKIAVAGRLGGADMSRRESNLQGSIPLHTLRADIDFARSNAMTTYGVIGVKAWVYRGELKEEDHEMKTGVEV